MAMTEGPIFMSVYRHRMRAEQGVLAEQSAVSWCTQCGIQSTTVLSKDSE